MKLANYRVPIGGVFAWRLLAILGLVLSTQAKARLVAGHMQHEILPFVQRNLAGSFAADAVLHDRETLTIGVANFNPRKFIPIDDEDLGDEDSRKRKNQIKAFTLPFTEFLPWHGASWESYFTGHLGFTQRYHEISLFEEIDARRDQERVRFYSLYLAGGVHWDLWSNWRLSAELGGSLRRMEQRYSYNNSISQQFQPLFDGILSNFSLNAWMLEPKVALEYQKRWSRHKFRYRSRLSQLYGESFGSALSAHQFNIQGTYWRNTAAYSHPLGRLWDVSLAGQLSWSRVDLTGHTRQALETPHYYELGFDLLMGTGAYGKGWLDNLNIGLIFNYGSAIKGGSLVLNYNTY
ncbi:Solitary outer membrane autotransporter beta-barrel domain [Agarivorans sp.]|uniref:Solitary outer membrane autotransporter beta-barrel domain n=1 Tax=Agarivorans sp. TaxID=1872412 RepID=UPI003D08E27B